MLHGRAYSTESKGKKRRLILSGEPTILLVMQGIGRRDLFVETATNTNPARKSSYDRRRLTRFTLALLGAD